MVRPSRHVAGASVTQQTPPGTVLGVSLKVVTVAAAAAAFGVGVRWWWRSRRNSQRSCPPGNNDTISPSVLRFLHAIENSTATRSGSPKLSGTPVPPRAPDALSAVETDPPPLPVAVVDTDAFRANVVSMAIPVLRQGKAVRIVTKSLRVPHLIEMAAEIVREEHRRILRRTDSVEVSSPRKELSGRGGSAASDSLEDFVHVESGSQTSSGPLPPSGKDGSEHCSAAPPRKTPWDPVSGLMTFSAKETLFWVQRRSFSSVLLGYPVCDTGSARVLAAAIIQGQQEHVTRKKVWCICTVDDVQQVALLVHCLQDQLAASSSAPMSAVTLKLVIDVDMSFRPLGDVLHLGVRRSPIRTDRDVAALVSAIDALSQSLISERIARVEVVGLMGYEAQIAGVQDVPFSAGPLTRCVVGAATRLFKSWSTVELASRRSCCVDKLHLLRRAASCVTDGPLLVNGGGSGSVLTTAADVSVSEVSIGSGALCGHLFDRYHASQDRSDAAARRCCFQPALFVFLPVCRVASERASGASSMQSHVVCNGGGWHASGPVHPDRAPIVVYPPVGLSILSTEGFGEVQTPFQVQHSLAEGQHRMMHGSVVVVRPAKSGELAEVFSTYTVLRDTDDPNSAPAVVKTYRGEGVDSW